VRIRFQLTPGTEAPAEMNFYFPDFRALCMAENATHNLHNVLTLRGALVRDPRVWSRYLGQAIDLYTDDVDVSFASHHWPTWGRERVVRYLAQQRDLYAYLHDQTLRWMNKGYTGIEIAEMIELPPELDAAWHTRGYYGSVSHNVKAIYQRYMGWFDGNPANLWQHPPIERAARYVESMGGTAAVLERAQHYVDADDLRFAAELLNHVVFADPTHDDAKELLAQVYTRLGYGSENGTWRNFYLNGAKELREGVVEQTVEMGSELVASLSIEQLFDAIAIRIDGPSAWNLDLAIDWVFTDLGERWRTTLSNGVLIPTVAPDDSEGELTVTLTKPQFLALLARQGLDEPTYDGDASLLVALVGVLDTVDPNFAIVTP